MSDIPSSVVISARYSLWVDFSLNQEKFNEGSIDRSSNSLALFRLVLRSLTIVGEQCELHSCVDSLRTDACESAACVQSPNRQVAVHPVKLNLAPTDMTRLKTSVEVAHHRLADTQ